VPEATLVLTVRDAVARTTELLARAGCEAPRLDAELLVAQTLAVGRERLVLEADRRLDAEMLPVLDRMTARRCSREPIAYILGRKPFRHITLAVDRRVLIPRPETEVLVEVGLTLASGARVVDVGTGSGALALALKHERPDLEVWATDVSADALVVAQENARSLGLDVEFVHGDLLEGVPVRVDAVLSNLPYVALDYALPSEIADFEPPAALYGGTDGLAVIRRLIVSATDAPMVALEVGFDQAAAVSALLRDAGFDSTEVLRDLAGHERVVVGRTA
jgi:release factor glutamine methyltransferase